MIPTTMVGSGRFRWLDRQQARDYRKMAELAGTSVTQLRRRRFKSSWPRGPNGFAVYVAEVGEDNCWIGAYLLRSIETARNQGIGYRASSGRAALESLLAAGEARQELSPVLNAWKKKSVQLCREV